MIHDVLQNFGQIDFSVDNLITGATGQVEFPEIFDVGAVANDIGKGELLQVEFTVDEAPTTDYHVFQGALAMTNNLVGLVAAIQGGTADIIGRSGDVAAPGATSVIHTGNFRWLEATEGLRFYMSVPSMPRNQGYDGAGLKRYMGVALSSVLGSTAISTGKMTARLVLGAQQDHVYPAGFGIV